MTSLLFKHWTHTQLLLWIIVAVNVMLDSRKLKVSFGLTEWKKLANLLNQEIWRKLDVHNKFDWYAIDKILLQFNVFLSPAKPWNSDALFKSCSKTDYCRSRQVISYINFIYFNTDIQNICKEMPKSLIVSYKCFLERPFNCKVTVRVKCLKFHCSFLQH